MSERDLVFFSYRQDGRGERWLSALLAMLEPYVLSRRLIAWSDRDIRVGEQWHDRIQSAIDHTRVAVLLVNHRFFGSKYICQHELPRLVADAHAGRLALVIVVVGAVDPALMKEYGLSSFQAANPPDRPISGLRGSNLDKALVAIAVTVRKAYGMVSEREAMVMPAIRQGDAIDPGNSGTSLGPLLDVPPYDPARFVARPDDIAALRRILIEGSELTLGVTSSAPGLGLHGMGGMGKSVLALALCHDDALRRAFPDGVAWVVLGQTPDLLAAQNRLLRLLDGTVQPVETQAEGTRRLIETLQKRRALVVLDDAWCDDHVRALDVLQGQSRLLVTTRDASVLSLVNARTYGVQRLAPTLACELLALRALCRVDELPSEAEQVVEHTAGLPLAVALAGAQIADGLSWTTLVDELRQGHVDFLDHAYGSIYACMGRSVDALSPSDRDRYLDLAAFPEDEAVPMGVVARLWRQRGGLSAAQAEQLLVRLQCKALLMLSGSGPERTVSLHDLQLDFVRWRTTDPAALHRALLDAYRPSAVRANDGGSCWSRLLRDTPYLWRRLTMHLAAAGLDGELEEVLLDADWIRARLAVATRPQRGQQVADVAALLRDFQYRSASADVRRVKRALEVSAHRLIGHPAGLDQHLHGRLGRDAGRTGRLADRCLAELHASGSWTPMHPGLAPRGAMIATLSAHAGPVSGALLLPDGRRVLSWSGDDTLRLWDLDALAEPRVFNGHEGWVIGVLLLPDGRRALSFSEDKTLRLWDLDEVAELRVFTGHEASLRGVLLLPGGGRALSWSVDGTLQAWALDDAAESRVLTENEGWLSGPLLLLPDGRRALSWSGDWSEDQTLRLWDLDVSPEARVLAGHAGSVCGALLLPDGRRALSWSKDRTLRVWDLDSAAQTRELTGHEDSVNGALLLPDGRRALSWSKDRTLRVWDLNSAAQTRELTGHEDSVNGAVLLPDGRRALSWSRDQTLRVWDLDGAAQLRMLTRHAVNVRDALPLRDGRRALTWSDDPEDHTLRLWDLDSDFDPVVLPVNEPPMKAALLLPNGRRALSWSEDVWNDHALRLWNLDGALEARLLAGHTDSVEGALLLPDGRRALSWSRDHCLRLWDLEGAADRLLAGHAGPVEGALLLPNGRRALSWSDDCTLRLWDLDGVAEPRVLAGHEHTVTGALLLPDSRRVLSWSANDGTLRLWDLHSAKELHVLTRNNFSASSALLLPDGRRVLTWSRHHMLWLWDLDGIAEPRMLAGHESWVEGALLLPDGRRALSWSRDSTLRVWDLDCAAELRVLTGNVGFVRGMLLLPDGRRALSWSDDCDTLRLWDLEGAPDARVLAGHEDSVSGALVLLEGRRALSWSKDRTLRLWDLGSLHEIARYDLDAVPSAVAVSPTPPCRIFVGDALACVHLLALRR